MGGVIEKTPSIPGLEAALRVEEHALEGAYMARNQVAVALYKGTLKRAADRLLAARIEAGEL